MTERSVIEEQVIALAGIAQTARLVDIPNVFSNLTQGIY